MPQATLRPAPRRRSTEEEPRQTRIDLGPGREIVVTLRTVDIATAFSGKALQFTFVIEAWASVTEAFLSSLGFDARRLLNLGIVPEKLLIATSQVRREATAEEEARLKQSILERAASWIKNQDFEPVIQSHIRTHLRQGPGSRLRSTEGLPPAQPSAFEPGLPTGAEGSESSRRSNL